MVYIPPQKEYERQLQGEKIYTSRVHMYCIINIIKGNWREEYLVVLM